jgi:hypothetical protein
MEGGMILNLMSRGLEGITFYHIPTYRKQLQEETGLDLTNRGEGSYLAAVESPMINSCMVLTLYNVNTSSPTFNYMNGHRWTAMTAERVPVCASKIKSGILELPVQMKRLTATFVNTDKGVQTFRLGRVELSVSIPGSTHCGQNPDVYSLLHFAKKYMIRVQ